MLNKLFGKLSGQSRKKGFTMTELLTVIGIIAIVCAIAIPAIISISRSLAFKQANEYAESIFMAAQANLTEMKSDGRLIDLFVNGNGAEKIDQAAVDTGFPNDEIHREQYMYATSKDGVYDVLLPATSIDSDARNGNVLIEYNPYTGNVYSVFYKDGGDPLGYTEGDGVTKVTRNEDERRDLRLGYYCGSALSATPLTPEETEANISCINGEEFIVQVIIPIPQSYKAKQADFENGLEVDLTVTGSTSTVKNRFGNGEDGKGTGSFTTCIKRQLDNSACSISEDGKSVIVSYTLDSLKDKSSFANYGQLDGVVSSAANASFAKVMARSEINTPDSYKSSLTSITEDKFNIYPGENVSISADINFKASGSKGSVRIYADSCENVNPMFEALSKSSTDANKWVITVSNGRNLQNLNAVSATIAKDVKNVSFGEDIDWNDTVTYYKNKGVTKNSEDEAPARALPYFVPIHNENLFGTAQFIYPTNDDTLWERIKEFIDKVLGIPVNQKSDVPTLTDELDRVVSNGKLTKTPKAHATISGNGNKVLNLDIDSSKYALGKNFYAGDTSGAERDRFTGLFGYVNTTIDGLSVVNPKIEGYSFDAKNNPATGALVGATGFNSLIKNCSAYIDTKDAGFNRSLLPGSVVSQPAYNDNSNTYGVKGSGAVGGLVGYAKSHRTVTGELTDDESTLAFSNCFAAVPVSGNMRGTNNPNNKHYGYTNGVGGLVGNAEISNFYNCYASGDVKADGVYVEDLDGVTGAVTAISGAFASLLGEDNVVDLLYNGRTSMGVGGFVGTSHGVRYTNCYASGDVLGKSSNTSGIETDLSKKGTAGFVGIMSYEETHAYGNDVNSIKDREHTDVAQMTVFQNCYAVGTAKILKGDSSTVTNIAENFSGANCRIKFDGFGGTATKYWSGNYYQVYAPWWFGTKGTVVNGIERMPYESFIFKDSYYISPYITGDSDQTNACAIPASYKNLTNLTAMQNDTDWIEDQITSIQRSNVSDVVRNLRELFGIEDGDKDDTKYTYGGIYFGKWINKNIVVERILSDSIKYQGPRYGAPSNILYWTGGATARKILDGGISSLKKFPECVRVVRQGDTEREYYANSLGDLEGIYTKLYKEGFPAEKWDKGSDGNATHAYDVNATGKYPFTKLKGLDYYGRWPALKIACGLAYYEQYADGTYGYYFDRDGTSTLQDQPVVSDGYAILTSAANDKITVRISGEDYTVNNNDDTYTATYTTENSVYYVHRLPWAALQNASSSEFYTQITATVSGSNGTKTYTMYFNPNVALSQVNPADTDGTGSNTAATKPTTAPTQVYIRSARQLAALGKSTMNAYTANENINFEQQLDIDASAYTGKSYGDDAARAKNAAVNNASVANLGASYSGKTASEKSPVISGFAHPIFTVIGETGSVSDLEIISGGKFDGSNVDMAGLLAGTNNGTVTNVDVKITTATTINANKSAGLLIGVNSGTISNCDATVSANATVTAADNAGGLIGVNSGKVENCNAEIKGSMTVNSANAGGIVGMAMPGSVFNNVEVSGKDLSGSDSLGAFAGQLNTARVSDVTVNINGSIEATNTAAGLADTVISGTLQKITVNVAGGAQINATKTAAGLIGYSESANISDITLNLAGTVTGENAVGAAGDIEGGTTDNVKVLLNSGKITAANNAAGFILEADSTIQNSYVVGSGEIKATAANGNAAGFAVTAAAAKDNSGSRVFNCFVSPADHTNSDLKAAYRASDLSKLKITAASGNAAGFAVNVTGVVESCTALGTVTGAANQTAGFAVNVTGAITGSMANTANNGRAFAAKNEGLVSNSYAWYKGESSLADAINTDENGATHYYACYFAPLSSESEKPVTVVKGREVVPMTYDELADLPLDELCPMSDVDAPAEGNIWKLAGRDSAYPFTEMHPSNYAYPMLREHYGDWVNPTQYAYGLVYYEKYTDGSIGMNLEDVSFIGETDSREHYSLDTLENDTKTISETGYALFFHNHKQIMDISLDDKNVEGYDTLGVTEANLAGLKLGNAEVTDKAAFLGTYEFRIIPGTQNAATTEAVKVNGLDDGVHMFVPAYANAITANWTAPTEDTPKATYEIRTAAQFANINKSLGEATPAEGFNQTHSFTMSTAVTLENFKGLTYTAKSDNLVHSITVGENVTLPHGIFGAVSEKSEISDVTVIDAKLKASKTAGIIADTVDKDSSITNVTLYDPAIEIAVDKYDANTSVDVGAVVGKNSGTIKNAAVMMTPVKDSNGVGNREDVYGNTLHKTFKIDASATKLTATQLKLNVGGIVGSNEGSITADTENAKLKTSVTGNIEFTPVSFTKAASGTTALNELVKVGGIAGVNTKSVTGDMNGDVVYKTFALPADSAAVNLTNVIKLGGLVGHSTSTNTNGASVSGTVTGSVLYTRPAVVADKENAANTNKTVSDGIMLGGLVGQSERSVISGKFDGNNVKTDKNEPAKSVEILKAVNIPAASDTENDIFVQDVATANGDSYIGGAVGNMTSGSFGSSLTASGSVSIDGKADNVYAGGIAGSVNGTSITNAAASSAVTVNATATNAYIGGAVGKLDKGTVSGVSASGLKAESSSVTLNATATNAYIGGAIGYTNGVSVTNVTYAGNINAGGSGTRYVGGMVGYMNGGSMSASNKDVASATGEITVGNVTTDTYVGGAVGYESNATSFTKVKAEVKISNNGGSWISSSNVKADTAACPGSYANVGQFIGYVSKAQVRFTDCSGNGNNADLHFLGTIEKNRGTLTGNDFYSFTASGQNGTVEKREYISGWNKYRLVNDSNVQFDPVSSGTAYDNFAATLTNCYYTDQNSVQHQQQINTVKYFYTYAGDGKEHKNYKIKSFNDSVTGMNSGTDYLIVDYTVNYALTANSDNAYGKNISANKTVFTNGFDDKTNENYNLLWHCDDGNSPIKLMSNATSEYLRINSWGGLGIYKYSVQMKSKGDGQFKLVNEGGGYCYIKHYNDNRAGYMYCDNGTIGASDNKNDNNRKFKIYPVIAQDFTRGTMNSTSYYHEVIT